MPKCKVTVLKKLLYQDLADEYRVDAADHVPCERFEVGQEFVIDHPYVMPENFCTWAWADIHRDILTVAAGGDLPWMKQRGLLISGCTDWIRPVIFKIEKMQETD